MSRQRAGSVPRLRKEHSCDERNKGIFTTGHQVKDRKYMAPPQPLVTHDSSQVGKVKGARTDKLLRFSDVVWSLLAYQAAFSDPCSGARAPGTSWRLG